jgi:hypothetical protein
MFRKAACVLVLMGFGVCVAAADEFGAVIKKVDGNKITLAKVKGFGKNAEVGEDMTLTASSTVKVNRGKFNREEKKIEAGPTIEGGLSHKMFQNIGERGVRARITTEGDQITQILVFGGRKKKKDQ